MPWHLMARAGGWRPRALTEWRGAGGCRLRSAVDLEQVLCWVRVVTEMEFDEGDAIGAAGSVGGLGPAAAIARAGRGPAEVIPNGSSHLLDFNRYIYLNVCINPEKEGRAT